MQWVFLCFQKYNKFSFAALTNRFQKGTIPINAAAFIKKYGGFDMNILAIGNSFSQDATARLMDLAGQAGRPLAVCNLYIGGCSLEQHLCNAALNRMGYDLQENGQSTGRTVSIKEALSLKRWDWITMQQASHFSAFYERYQPWAKSLAAYVRHWAPEARLAVHQTWAYQAGSQRLHDMHFATSGEMFRAVEDCYGRMAQELQADLLIPSGKAMELARQEPDFDETRPDALRICRDTFHASMEHGRYLLAAVWFETFTGHAAWESSYCPEGIALHRLALLQRIAHEAVHSNAGIERCQKGSL